MTIFNTPLLSRLFKLVAWLALVLTGWRPGPTIPKEIKKCVVIPAPHTSYWDFAIFLPMVFALNLQVKVLIKHTLFWPPLGWFLRYCGGIPVDRRSARDYVGQMVAQFENNDSFHLVITPEGTRSPRTHWKTGFYHIAMAANVPIILAGIDCDKKSVGVDRIMYPSGDLEADLAEIYAFYDNVRGINHENYASPNRPAPEDADA
jgi:1-acyl-sn-glycerol-3-phosphate acyltransferase